MNSAQFGGLIRHLLTIVGGGLGLNGLQDDSNFQLAGGIILALLGAAHSFWVKRPANTGSATTTN